MKHRIPSVVALVVAVALCLPAPAADVEPERVRVQHLLVGFRGSVAGKQIKRSRKAARLLAEDLLRRAKGGEDFDALVREHTDDRYPGLYRLSNFKVEPGPKERRRRAMVKGFGDVAFALEPGEIGMAPHHPTRSPYGWHIIKRLE